MTTKLTQEVIDRLSSDHHGWLTTVAKSGQPVPRLVWFYFDGAALTIYTEPSAAKVVHIKARPRVSFHLDSDGNGGGIIVVGGDAVIDAEGADPRDDDQMWDKYHEEASEMGLTESLGAYDTRLKISIERVWTTPVPE